MEDALFQQPTQNSYEDVIMRNGQWLNLSYKYIDKWGIMLYIKLNFVIIKIQLHWKPTLASSRQHHFGKDCGSLPSGIRFIIKFDTNIKNRRRTDYSSWRSL